MNRLTSNEFKSGDLALLILRMTFGLFMMLNHGWGKLVNFSERSEDFYNFLGLGSSISLGLTIFAEFVCAFLLAIGLFTRLATIPLIATMLVAILVIHGADPIADREMAFLYLAPCVAILLMGPGRYSLDRAISGSTPE